MKTIQTLITDHLDIWTAADTEKKSGRGRSSGSAGSVYGVKKLRELILELAVRGKLVPQDESDEPASELLKRIAAEKAKLIAEGKIKKSKPLAEITDDEKPFELPTGWEWAKLGEITNFGITEKLGFISDETWVLDLEDIEKDTSRLLNKKSFCDRRSLSDKNSFQEGDVLYGKLRPYLNKVIVADESGVCTTEIFPIRCYGSFSSHYFKYALKSPYFINYVNARSYGMKMPRLGTEDGRRANFPLPPIAEQHRIVAKVDELMALCDQLENQHNDAAEAHEKLVTHLLGTLTQSQNAEDFNINWQRISEHFDNLFTTEASIDALKQTLLQLAVMGKLIPQDPNDEPASELLKRIQAEKAKLITDGKIKKEKSLPLIINEDEKAKLPSGWVFTYMQNITKVITCGMASTPTYHDSGKIFLSAKNIKPNRFMPEDHKFVDEETFRKITQNANPEKDDILLTRVGAGIGEAAIINIDIEFAYYVSLTLIKPFIEHLDSNYLLLWLNSPDGVQKSLDNIYGGGVSQGNLNVNQVRGFKLPIPPKEEQFRIITKTNKLMAICDQLKARIIAANKLQQKLADVVIEQAIN
jgi:type I restriction enzyme S subunit